MENMRMEDSGLLETEFAPAERASQEEVAGHFEQLLVTPLVRDLLRAIPNIVLVLNYQRQIVLANDRLLEHLQLRDFEQVLGQRPGELLNCIHAFETPGGCGTTRFCRYCGAVRAILRAQQGKVDVEECRIIQDNGKALDLRVWTTPIDFNGETLVIFAVMDIEDEKRRAILERTFFHDILNTAGLIRGSAELLPVVTEPERVAQLQSILSSAVQELIEEIRIQRELNAAEQGDLPVNFEPVTAYALLCNLARSYATHSIARQKHIQVTPPVKEIVFYSDPRLLTRVLGNLIKNALEASQPDEVVTLHCAPVGDAVQFTVHNSAVMTAAVQAQMFQRSFSTKGAGRGIGTYSVKLLTEHYLHGKVDFQSQEGMGTTFSVTYPLIPPGVSGVLESERAFP